MYPLKKLDMDIKEFEKLTENFGEIHLVRKVMDSESDRGCCLTAVSFIDNELEDLLKATLIGTGTHFRDLFSSNGPFSNLSSKIKICYSLGFLSQEAFEDLEIIRKIRNDFSHNYEPVDFENKAIREKIYNLKTSYYDLEKDKSIPAKRIFKNAFYGILSEIHSTKHKAKKFVTPINPTFSDKEAKKQIREQAESLMAILKDHNEIGQEKHSPNPE